MRQDADGAALKFLKSSFFGPQGCEGELGLEPCLRPRSAQRLAFESTHRGAPGNADGLACAIPCEFALGCAAEAGMETHRGLVTEGALSPTAVIVILSPLGAVSHGEGGGGV